MQTRVDLAALREQFDACPCCSDRDCVNWLDPEFHDPKGRVQLLLDIAEAVAQAGPWPMWIHNALDGYHCAHCHGWHPESFDEVEHGPQCAGVRLASLLARLTTAAGEAAS